MYREKKAQAQSGWFMLFVLIVVLVLSSVWFVSSARAGNEWGIAGSLLVLMLDILGMVGLTIVNPNQGVVVLLFGTYLGTLRDAGFWWVNPLTLRRRVSLRVRNFESAKLKVNDHLGNPVEIAAIVVWKVVDTAEAIFEVDNYDNFIKVQTEAALRNLATSYPYDAHEDGQKSLRANTAEVAEQLKCEVQARLEKAGIQIIETRISHLAYAPEIAGAMLRRQQATAIVAARQKFVEGAVGMVEMALDKLSERKLVQLDEERKATMVSNLLVVLCSDQHTQPVINTGTLYQ